MRFLTAETIGMLLAALALFVGFVHVIEIIRVRNTAKTQAILMIAHTEALDKIIGSLSTRLLGVFPDYYEKIAELIGQAEERIVVFCDSPAYGSFSKRGVWEFHYHYNLKRQFSENGRGLEITCLNEKRRREAVKSQFFGSGKSWTVLKQDPAFVKKLQELLNAHPKSSKVADLSQVDFEDILESEEESAIEDLPGVKFFEIDAEMPLYFWLIDSKTVNARAIFAIPSLSERIIEYAFTTTDQGLINAFEQMRERYHKPLRETAGEMPACD